MKSAHCLCSTVSGDKRYGRRNTQVQKNKGVFLVSIVTISVLSAREPIFSDIPGSYAIYHDRRFGTEAFIGLCYAGEDTLLVRTFEPGTNTEMMLFIPFIKTPEGLSLGEQLNIIKGSMTASDSTQRVLPMVLNWSATWFREQKNIQEKITHSASTDDDFVYESWIPVFNIRTIGSKDEFTVITAGRLTENTGIRFFEFTGLAKAVPSESFTLKQGISSTLTIDGLSVMLNENWKTEDNRVFRIAI